MSLPSVEFNCVVVDFVMIVTFRVAFFNCESFKSHCLSSILHMHSRFYEGMLDEENSCGGGEKERKKNSMRREN